MPPQRATRCNQDHECPFRDNAKADVSKGKWACNLRSCDPSHGPSPSPSSSPSPYDDMIYDTIVVNPSSHQHPALADFLDTAEPSLVSLATTWKYAIGNATVPVDVLPTSAQSWDQQPRIIPSSQVWTNGDNDYDDFFVGLISRYPCKNVSIWSNGRPCERVGFAQVVDQVTIPDPVGPCTALNMETPTNAIQVPDQLALSLSLVLPSAQDIPPPITTTNITPKYSFVDLHIDHGKHVLATSVGKNNETSTTLKLWALYPPTVHNRQVCDDYFSTADDDDDDENDDSDTHSTGNSRFLRAHYHLQDGIFVITTPATALYLPPACIHATYTLSSCCFVSGLEFFSIDNDNDNGGVTCLRASAASWDLDRTCNLDGAGEGDMNRPLMEIAGLCLDRGEDDVDGKAEAHEILCERWDVLGKDWKGVMSPSNVWGVKVVERLKGEMCMNCGGDWDEHLEGGRRRSERVRGRSN